MEFGVIYAYLAPSLRSLRFTPRNLALLKSQKSTSKHLGRIKFFEFNRQGR